MKTESLFDLTSDALKLHNQIQDIAELLFGEDAAEVEEATSRLEQLITLETDNRKALEKKADAWCWVIDTIRARSAAQAEHAQRLKALAVEADRQADTLQARLVKALGKVDPDATKWELPQHKLTSRRSTAVDLDPDCDVMEMPEEYRRSKTTWSADKTAIKAALVAGTKVDGAQLVERRSWTIQ
jgi:hypothetical protein